MKLFYERADRECGLFGAAYIQDDAASVHHDQAIAKRQRMLHVVGNHQGGELCLGDRLGCGGHDDVGGARVKRRRMFVKQQSLRDTQDRHQQRQGLALTARKQAHFGRHAVFQTQPKT